jgi:5'-nucleotidase
MLKSLKILLTNDDGYASPGIKSLYDAFGSRHKVTIAAPQKEQSGVGHAFTFNKPLGFCELPVNMNMPGYMISGTPSDCVKFAVSHLLPEKPDAVISGINRGENSGISGYYSGTLAAAREGAFWRIPSFAFSLAGEEDYFADYARQAIDIFEKVLSNPPPTGQGGCIYYNVNFPACPSCKSRGIKITRQSLAFFDDRYKRIEVENLPDEFIIYGEKVEVEQSDDFDSRALISGYTTVTPLCLDTTAHWTLPTLYSIETKRQTEV